MLVKSGTVSQSCCESTDEDKEDDCVRSLEEDGEEEVREVEVEAERRGPFLKNEGFILSSMVRSRTNKLFSVGGGDRCVATTLSKLKKIRVSGVVMTAD